jgi:hypothetical protein
MEEGALTDLPPLYPAAKFVSPLVERSSFKLDCFSWERKDLFLTYFFFPN